MFSKPQINLYVADAERSARFYCERFGFAETFRTPQQGEPVHVELELDGLTLGVASRQALRKEHGVVAGAGPSAEVVLWVDDVDAAHAALEDAGVRTLSPPHDFLDGKLRSTWVADPDDHCVQIVSRLP